MSSPSQPTPPATGSRAATKSERLRQIADYLDSVYEMFKVLTEKANPMFAEFVKAMEGNEMQDDLRQWAEEDER